MPDVSDEIEMIRYDMRTAQVHVDEKGDWILTVVGTDLRHRLWGEDDISSDIFPGHAMGSQLLRFGWMPDRSDMDWDSKFRTPEQQLDALARGGWRWSPTGHWEIPCWRELPE